MKTVEKCLCIVASIIFVAALMVGSYYCGIFKMRFALADSCRRVDENFIAIVVDGKEEEIYCEPLWMQE